MNCKNVLVKLNFDNFVIEFGEMENIVEYILIEELTDRSKKIKNNCLDAKGIN